MKKNTMMRIASTLLIAVLLTTCAIGATFAKYTVANTVADQARVAKWGVEVTVGTADPADTDVFDKTYAKDDENATITTVVSSDTKVVAPGTTGSLEFEITGKPEVATRVTFTINAGTTDISIPANTEVAAGNTIQNAYNPVKFSLTKNGEAVANATKVSLTEMMSVIDALDEEYEANSTELAATYVLSWVWDFDDNGAGTNDAADTYLGNVADGAIDDDTTSTTLTFSFTITVDQID